MGLVTVAQVRAAGFGSPGWVQSTYSDALIQGLIDTASQLIEERTGQRFSATTLTLWLEGSRQQMLGPIRPALDTITGLTVSVSSSDILDGTTDYTAGQVAADVELVELEGRKCKQYLRIKDTTNVLPGRWPMPARRGDPNIKLTSSHFGWLDNSGSPTGQTPQPIQQLTIDLVADLLISGYVGSTSSTTTATGSLKREKIDVWEREYFQSANESIARALDDDLAQMTWSAYACPKPMATVKPFLRG